MAKTPKRPRGRPTTYTETVGRTICERMAAGESLRAICRDEGMPPFQTVLGWVLDGESLPADDPRHAFSVQYARAEQIRAMEWASEIMDIADDGTNDFMERQREDGETFVQVDKEHVMRSRLRVDTRKWALSKVLPKVYGDKVKIGAEGGGAVTFVMNIAGTDGDDD